MLLHGELAGSTVYTVGGTSAPPTGQRASAITRHYISDNKKIIVKDQLYQCVFPNNFYILNQGTKLAIHSVHVSLLFFSRLIGNLRTHNHSLYWIVIKPHEASK
jgi:hypothetical protein